MHPFNDQIFYFDRGAGVGIIVDVSTLIEPAPTPTATSTFTPTPSATPSSTGPTASINDLSVTEGTGGTTNLVFTVSLSAQTSSAVTVDYTVIAGTASAAKDYGAASPVSPLTIPANTLSRTITIPVVTDNYAQPAETVMVMLSGATNAVLATGEHNAPAVRKFLPAEPLPGIY